MHQRKAAMLRFVRTPPPPDSLAPAKTPPFSPSSSLGNLSREFRLSQPVENYI